MPKRLKTDQVSEESRWLMLVHQLPAKPAYHRVKVWRLLQESGAISLKNAVYVLPSSESSLATFANVLREVERHHGDGFLYEAELVAGMRDDQLRTLFNTARDVDYHAVAAELRRISQAGKKPRKAKGDAAPGLARIRQRMAVLGKIDFFNAPGRTAAEALLARLEHQEIVRVSGGPAVSSVPAMALTGNTWVTRRDIHVDRIACAWLIKRFIDPKGKFKFVAGKQYEPRSGEYRYDMQDGEFTHEGDKCSFETLLYRLRISDPALNAIAEIIHDIDLKDGKFGRGEATGIAHVISGICRTQGDDEARVVRGTELFNDVYEQFRRKPRR